MKLISSRVINTHSHAKDIKMIKKTNILICLSVRAIAAYHHADDRHSEVGPSQVNRQSALCLQDVIDVLGDGVFHWGETEGLLEGLVQVNGTQKLENTWHGVAIAINLRAKIKAEIKFKGKTKTSRNALRETLDLRTCFS